jgi:hypothetical protein
MSGAWYCPKCTGDESGYGCSCAPKQVKKTLGQIAYEARLGGTRPFCAWEDFAPTDQDGWERAAQAVITAYEAQRKDILGEMAAEANICSADTGPKPTAPEPAAGCRSDCHCIWHDLPPVRMQS